MGCGLRIGEDVFTRNMDNFSLSCLNGMEQKIKHYMTGQMGKREITRTFDCASQALRIFKDRVRGKRSRSFTPNELRTFIQNLFLRDKTINDPLLDQMMRLKSVIIGGSERTLTAKDVDRFIHFLNILKQEVIFFQPYIQTLLSSGRLQPLLIKNKSGVLNQELRDSVIRLSRFLKRFSNPYYFSDLQSLMYELDLIVDGEGDRAGWERKIKILSAFKSFIVSGSRSAIQPTEWENLLPGYVHLMSALIHYRIFTEQVGGGEQHSVLSPRGMEWIFGITTHLMDFLSLSIQNRKARFIPAVDLTHLLSQLSATGFIPYKLTESSLMKIAEILFLRIFRPDPGSLREGKGVIFTAGQMNRIKDLIHTWIRSTKIFNQTTGLPTPLLFNHLGPLFSAFPHSFSQGEKTRIKSLFDFRSLFQSENRVHLSGDLFASGSGTREKNHISLVLLNTYQLMTQMLRAGYEENYPTGPGLSRERLNTFFNDFVPFAADMKWLESGAPSSISPSEAAFIAANMFTPSADGGFHSNVYEPEYLKPVEIVEYFSYLFSIFFSIRDFENRLRDLCPPFQPVRGSAQYDRACVKFHFLRIVQDRVSNMPDLIQALKDMSLPEKEELTEALIHISFETREAYETTEKLEYFHIRNMFIALYFSETIFIRYDQNLNRTLEHEEILSAYRRFEGFIVRTFVELMCWSSEEALSFAPTIYAYIIYNKKIPNEQHITMADRLWLTWHKINYTFGQTHSWDLQLKGRKDLIHILSLIIKGYLQEKEARGGRFCTPTP